MQNLNSIKHAAFLVHMILIFVEQLQPVNGFGINNRREALNRSISQSTGAFFIGLGIIDSGLQVEKAVAAEEKLMNLSDEELKAIVLSDLEKDFLVSADITRAIYDESATFTDEIDVYTMDKWIKGTKALFVAEKSKLDILGDVNVNKDKVEFSFREDLMFRIPFRPVCSLSGKVVLSRDPSTGLITKYREVSLKLE